MTSDLGDRAAIACPICGSTSSRTVRHEDSWRICRCTGCSLIYVNPQPVRGPSEDVEYLGGIGDAPGDEAMVQGGLDDIERLQGPPRGRVLDVGSGYGYFLAAARDRGWDTYGVDVSAIGVANARDQLGLENVELIDLFDRAYPDGWFEAVTMWNVLEHVADPRALLVEAQRLLAPGGVLVIRVPNMDFHHPLWRALSTPRLFDRLGMKYLGGVPAPQHLFGFTPRTLLRLVGSVGLDVVEVSPAVPHYARDPKRWLVTEVATLAYRASGKRAVVSPTMLLFARRPPLAG